MVPKTCIVVVETIVLSDSPVVVFRQQDGRVLDVVHNFEDVGDVLRALSCSAPQFVDSNSKTVNNG